MKIPLLILGYERAGTTLLRRVMSMHPGLEFEIVHEKRNILFQCKTRRESLKRLTFPATQAGKKTGSVMSIRSGQKIPYRSSRVAIKAIRRFRKFFPGSWVVHIVRSPVACINSQVRTFKRRSARCIKEYFDSVPPVVAYMKNIDRAKQVSYEDFVSQPFEFVMGLFEWMGQAVGAEYVRKVIGSRDPWKSGGRVVPGLRYFDKIESHGSNIRLSGTVLDTIRSKEHLLVE